MDLDAIEAVRQLKYRYFRALDLKRWDEFGDTLAVDATGRYGTHALGEPLSLDGRDAITAFMRKISAPRSSPSTSPAIRKSASMAKQLRVHGLSKTR